MKLKLLSLIIILIISTSISAQCTRTGSFQDGPTYSVSGTGILEFLDDGTKQFKIESDFVTMSGPDLNLYLSNTPTISTSGGDPSGVINIGLLASITGTSTYPVPNEVNINDFAYLIVQCKQFNQPWGNLMFAAPIGISCSSLSIEEETLDKISFYPNPVIDEVTFKNSSTEVSYKLYNTLGHIIKNGILAKTQNTIALKEVNTGVYFIELFYKNKKTIKKIVVK